MERALERGVVTITPRATYRLQLRAGFGFNEAAAIAPYLARLGVSHVYLSPFFKARPGSAHGYDITNHAELNPELGTEAEYASMIHAFRREGLQRILDFVPNHMGVGGADNPLWLDVLEWGPESRYAGWFDIDWSAHDGAGQNKLLAPVLGEQYGEALRTGKLCLKFDDGAFAIWAYDEHKLPICPLTYPLILGHQNAALDRMADRFLDLPQWRPEIAERAHDLKAELAGLACADAKALDEISARVGKFNRDWRELDRLIGAQFWRVAFHRVAEDEINYRRFFNINDLAGLRMELAPVFEHAHARVFQMLEAEEIDGLRIDHVDGLFDPKAYLEALRGRVGKPFYLVVEKILAPHEQLRADWPVEGTTGYDYLNLALGILVDPSAEAAFTETYGAFAGASDEFEEIARLCRLRIMDNEMASELNALGRSCGAPCPPKSDDGGPHPGHLAARNQADRGELSCLSHLYRSDRLALRGRQARRRMGGCARASLRSGCAPVRLRLPAGCIVCGNDALSGERDQQNRRAAFCDEAATVLRTGHGEGRRGYRLLSLQSLPCTERSRRRARSLWARALPLPQSKRPAGGALAARHAGDSNS